VRLLGCVQEAIAIGICMIKYVQFTSTLLYKLSHTIEHAPKHSKIGRRSDSR
jgi:hypothetical protein